MNTRFKENVQKLFEYWCEISPTAIGEKSSGHIVESFPENYRDPEIITKIPEFAYPCHFANESVQTYSFVLTSTDSKWRFGFCRHDTKAHHAMVIITYLPWHDTFIKFLNVLGELKRSDNGEFQPFLSEAYVKGVPEPGASLKLFYNAGMNHFVFQRPSQFQLPSIPENHNLNLYYNFVDPKNMIAVFAAMLAERRIIFTSRRLDRLSSCVQAANAFLYPMVWQHIFIPILPMKMKEFLCAPMPYLIGVPEAVLETMTRDELGEVVILNCDNKHLETPFDDVKNMPHELVSQLKKHLSNPHEHIGDRVSKIFLGVLVQLIGGYRDAIKFTQGEKITWDRDTFIDSRPSHLRPFLRNMLELQIFQQFIEERLEMLNTGLGFSDEFELETLRHLEKSGRRGKHYKEFLRNVKDKTNPAVKSAVQSVKQGSRGVKTAYKDLKSKLRDKTPPKAMRDFGNGASSAGHRSAPNSPLKPVNSLEYHPVRPNRSGSLVHTPKHKSHRDVPTGTLCLFDDTEETGEQSSNESPTNSSMSFDSPPEASPPVPPRISNPPPNRVPHGPHTVATPPPRPVPHKLRTDHSPMSVTASMSFENNFVNNEAFSIANNKSMARAAPLPISPPTATTTNFPNTLCPEDEPDHSPNLIQLDSNTSFELEDFDPLNQNAKHLPAPPVPPPPIQLLQSAAIATTSTNRAQAFSNPVYPFYTPQRQPNIPPAAMATGSKSDDDVELLRQYGLDKFNLNDDQSQSKINGKPGGSQYNFSTGSSSKSIDPRNSAGNGRGSSPWTTFD